MNTKSEITIYEKNGEECHATERLAILSHWNRRAMVVLKIGAKEVTVSADELRRAIDAAQKAHSS